MTHDIIVLGAGMVGVGCALHLQAKGQAVALVDRRAPGLETSYGNAGIIQREAIAPYALPRGLGFLLSGATNQRVDVRYHALDAMRMLCQIGLEHLQLEADAARLAPQQELGVGKGQAVGVGLQRVATVGMGLKVGPGVGDALLAQVLCVFHAESSVDGQETDQSPMASASGTKTTASALPTMIEAATFSGS